MSVREKRRRGGAGPRETLPPKINLHEGGNEYLGGGERRREGEAARKSAEGNREREKGSACVCSGLKTAQFPDAHLLR